MTTTTRRAPYSRIGGLLAALTPFTGYAGMSARWEHHGTTYVVRLYGAPIASHSPTTGRRWIDRNAYFAGREVDLVIANLPGRVAAYA